MKRIAIAAAALMLLGSVVNYAHPVQKALRPTAQNAVFPLGERAPAANFTGEVYVYTLVKDGPTFNCVSGSVTFRPGAR